MTDIGSSLAGIVGQVLSAPAVSLALRLGGAYLALVWLACAWWAHADLRRRTRDPVAPWLAGAVVLLATPAGFLPALAVYLMVRPRTTVAERDAGELEQALLHAEAERPRCLGCAAPVQPAWVRCPSCGTTLAVECPRCGRQAGLDWDVCAWCAADLPWTAPWAAAPTVTPEHTAERVIDPVGVAAAGVPSASLRDVAGSVVEGLRRAGEAMLPAAEPVRWPAGAFPSDAGDAAARRVRTGRDADQRRGRGSVPPA